VRLRRVASFSVLYLFLTAVALLTALPFYWGLIASFRPSNDVFNPSLLPGPITAVNFRDLLTLTLYLRWFLNSCLVAICYTGLALFFCSLAGYAFSKFTFKAKNVLFMIVLASMMIPLWATLVPLYTLYTKINALNRYWVLIVPGSAPPLGIFMMRQYIYGIPSEMMDSARVDGCSEFRIYLSIILPVVTPALGALAIIMFMSSWNSFLIPLILMQEQARLTVPVGLASFIGLMKPMYGPLIAGTMISVLPVLIIFIRMQKELVSGITIGAVKG
jgi:ABC-type glycerol-3-phosphate transport system permease component